MFQEQSEVIEFKKCSKCEKSKPLNDFYSKGDGKDSYCKPCRLKQKKQKYRRLRFVSDIEVVFNESPDKRFLGSKLVPVVLSVLKEIGHGSEREDRSHV